MNVADFFTGFACALPAWAVAMLVVSRDRSNAQRVAERNEQLRFELDAATEMRRELITQLRDVHDKLAALEKRGCR